LGFEFDSKIVPFAARSAIQSFSTCALLFICGYLDTPLRFNLFFGVTAVIGIGAWLLVLLSFDFRNAGGKDANNRKASVSDSLMI
jgi:hypothetical protein